MAMPTSRNQLAATRNGIRRLNGRRAQKPTSSKPPRMAPRNFGSLNSKANTKLATSPASFVRGSIVWCSVDGASTYKLYPTGTSHAPVGREAFRERGAEFLDRQNIGREVM